MKAVISRVNKAAVSVSGVECGKIEKGLCVFLGVERDDTESDCEITAEKLCSLRVFCDENDRLNLSICDTGGQALVISNFTLCADVKKGTRPSFSGAMPPPEAERLYLYFCECLRLRGVTVKTGKFGADMKVSLECDGPVTIEYDSKIWRKI